MLLPWVRMAVLVVGCIAVCLPAQAASWYVAPQGSDAGDGSATKPWLSIQKAVNAASPGDEVVVLAGTYAQGMVFIKTKARADAPIVLRGEGEVHIIDDGAKVWHWGGLLEVDGAAHWTIRGLTLRNSSWFGVHIRNSSDVTVEGCRTADTAASGIKVGSASRITIRKNTVERACQGKDPNRAVQECISVSDTTGFEVTDNVVRDNTVDLTGGEGIDAKGAVSNGLIARNTVYDLVRLGIYVDAWDRTAQDIEIRDNAVFRCRHGIAVAAENGGIAQRIRIVQNVVYENRIHGIVIAPYGLNGPRRDIDIMHNTVVGNGATGSSWGGGIRVETTNAQNVVIRGNISALNLYWQVALEAAGTASVLNNLIYGFQGRKGYGEVKGSDVVEANPLLIDIAGGKLEPRADSPAIDAALDPTGLPDKDAAGRPRLSGSKVDLGAYEYHENYQEPPGTGGMAGMAGTAGTAGTAGAPMGTGGGAGPGAAGAVTAGTAGASPGVSGAAGSYADEASPGNQCQCRHGAPGPAKPAAWLALAAVLWLRRQRSR
jgi:MYXO-CTERM domain-containing protein